MTQTIPVADPTQNESWALLQFLSEVDDELLATRRDAEPNVDKRVARQVDLCERVQIRRRNWDTAIFKGQLELDTSVESAFKDIMQKLLDRSLGVSRLKRNFSSIDQSTGCPLMIDAEFQKLLWYITEYHYLLTHWLTPQLSVSPAPRVQHSDETVAEIKKTLARLQIQ